MTLQQLASLDLNALTKAQLKTYVKEAREEWGRSIDLRSAKQPELIEYLQMFLLWKAQQVKKTEKVTTTTPDVSPEIEAKVEADLEAVNLEIAHQEEELKPDFEYYVPQSAIRSEALLANLDHPILNALDKLWEDNNNLLTTEGLSTLLEEYRCLDLEDYYPKTYPSLRSPAVAIGLAGFTPQNEPLLRRIAADPKGWTLDAPTEIQEGAAWYGRLNSLFSADDITYILHL